MSAAWDVRTRTRVDTPRISAHSQAIWPYTHVTHTHARKTSEILRFHSTDMNFSFQSVNTIFGQELCPSWMNFISNDFYPTLRMTYVCINDIEKKTFTIILYHRC